MKAAEIRISYKRSSSSLKISNSKDAAMILRDFWDTETIDYYESFVVMYLSRSNVVLGIMKVAEGCLDACLVDVRKIMQGALLSNSSSIIVAHNHPSGSLKASAPDITLTKTIRNAGELLKIKLLDHIILTSESYLSMTDKGLM